VHSNLVAGVAELVDARDFPMHREQSERTETETEIPYIEVPYCCTLKIVAMLEDICRSGGIGRRKGLKIQNPVKS